MGKSIQKIPDGDMDFILFAKNSYSYSNLWDVVKAYLEGTNNYLSDLEHYNNHIRNNMLKKKEDDNDKTNDNPYRNMGEQAEGNID